MSTVVVVCIGWIAESETGHAFTAATANKDANHFDRLMAEF